MLCCCQQQTKLPHEKGSSNQQEFGACKGWQSPRLIEKPDAVEVTDKRGVLALVKEAALQDAMKQLSFKHIHVDFTATGVLDYFLRAYAERLKVGEIAFLEWVNNEYDPETLQSAFDQRWPLAETLVQMRHAGSKIA